MNTDTFLRYVTRIFFVVGFGALALDAAEVIANTFGYTLLGGSYTKGRLLELAATLMVFAITILLRQIREGILASRPRTG
jgi:hypothetical protein